MARKRGKVPLGPPIRWSEMEDSEQLFLEMATPTLEEILIAMAAAVAVAVAAALEDAELVEDEDIVGEIEG